MIEDRVTKIEGKIVAVESTLAITASYQQQNTKDLNRLIEETKGLVQLQKDLQGVVRVGSTVQKVGVWLLKWPVGGGAIIAAYEFLQRHIH